MSDQMPPSPVQSLVDHPVARTVTSSLPLIRAGVLAVSVAAAIPTAHNLYYSWVHGIPYSQVPHRLAQYDLWMKNLDCKIDYRQLLTASGTKVDVGACQSSQDIAIKVSTAGGHSTYEWIAFDQLQKPTTVGLMNLFIGRALAEKGPVEPSAPRSEFGGLAPSNPSVTTPSLPFKVAENALQVMCQLRQGNQLVRVIQESGKCYREVVSMFRGTVDKRMEVPCATTCR